MPLLRNPHVAAPAPSEASLGGESNGDVCSRRTRVGSLALNLSGVRSIKISLIEHNFPRIAICDFPLALPKRKSFGLFNDTTG